MAALVTDGPAAGSFEDMRRLQGDRIETVPGCAIEQEPDRYERRVVGCLNAALR